ncbi:MAG TPA: hypothetical protein PKI86_05835 [Chitinophagales bacterium]|nr:hypothetical protein [Chitinophagales bacterium]
MQCKNIFLAGLIIIICQTLSLSQNSSTADSVPQPTFGKKVNVDFYEFIAFDTTRSVHGNPKVIETRNYYDDLKEWAWEDSSLYDTKGRLIYFNNYHDVKSFIYDDDKLLFYSRKDSDKETYVYWFFYDSFGNPVRKVIAVEDNFTHQYKLYEVEIYHTEYYKDSVVVNKKSSNEYIFDKNGFTNVFDRNGYLKSEYYVNRNGVLVYSTYKYQKFSDRYVLKEKETEASKDQIKNINKTTYLLDSLGNVIHKEERGSGIFNAFVRQNTISTTVLKDSTRQIKNEYYFNVNLQHMYYNEYDKFGNILKNAEISYESDNSFFLSINDYKYDAKNNWILKTEYMQETDRDLKPTRKKMKLVTYARKITYYENGERYVPEKVPEIPSMLTTEINKLEKELE